MGDEVKQVEQALENVKKAVEEEELPTLAEFLVGTPLLESKTVRAVVRVPTNQLRLVLWLPEILLYCVSEKCSGFRAHDPPSNTIYLNDFEPNKWFDELIYYSCRHCQQLKKTYAIRFRAPAKASRTIEILKLGEEPAFGEPRPNLIKDVLEDEIKYFELGYRAETAGLGIGAFAYYRRFVESHKDKIIAEIRKVAVAQGAKQEVLDTLDKAAKMNSFENAVKTVKEAIPDSLRLNGGHNPLTLLHQALSDGLHNDDDQQCLELAKDIRLLLEDLAERTTQALRKKSELSQAVNRLLKKATARTT